jgi:hypothetical protein
LLFIREAGSGYLRYHEHGKRYQPTPVKEAPQLALAPRKPVIRYVMDNLRDNAVSIKVARELNVPINDLAIALHDAGPEQYRAFDGVLGKQVAAAIRKAIES